VTDPDLTSFDPAALAWRKSSRSGPSGGNCAEVAPVWRKSSRSGSSGGQCVEVSTGPARIAVRDSKDPAGPVLTFAPAAWRGFLAGVNT
jgi:hypothetical protein